ncbi:DNA helicase IV [Jatrophihabitans endophyticus]|uniref:DNA helicase IV n=1 Tax=Jatrophihabitans endophyticus TaxID=1206085 RepID=A0A1M5TZ45_9ACTN|nr:ATP-binding domain-containing protein [Jatrophihabitans endophyticus]SHH55653.1 DNA helicase IV [Jatrophihabitans endophyticus]
MSEDQNPPAAPAAPAPEVVEAELAIEQRHVTRLYELRDRLLTDARAALARTASSGTVGTPGARTERDAFMRLYGERVRTLENVEARMCFGRLDVDTGERRYVGRIGLSDEERHELLVDWRAPAAEPFYQATAARPGGVLRRRQISTTRRRVTDIQDEVLDLAGFEAAGVDGGHVVVGEGALFASLDAARGSRMRDIVATIQSDQDAVIRAPLAGVLVVQGGPGTGKTAVALHRTAFLLYANRERIARSGVLLVGPNRVFLRYIDQVLPALGEADAVVMATPGELYQGVVATAVETADVVTLKGELRMARVIAEAVKRRQRLINSGRPLDVEGTVIRLQPRYVREAREAARRSRAPHNVARRTFVSVVMRHLVRALAAARGTDVDDDTRPGLLAELYAARDVRRELNLCWPPISPERLLRDLFAVPERLAEAAPRLGRDERARLRRDRGAPWSAADVPLLDEAAELLGADETSDATVTAARAEAERRAEVEYARQVQDTFGGADFGTAEQLASRYAGGGSFATVAEQAETDRAWAFGHVVVDEAQELSPMMWRLLMRRCPSRSFTVVGDVAQTGSAAGTTAWSDVLAPHVGDRWRQAELTVNYRTPEQVMDLAAAVLRAAGSSVQAPTSARVGRHEPVFTRTADDPCGAAALADVVTRERQDSGGGTVAVITPAAGHDTAVATVRAALPEGIVTADSDALGSPVSVLTVAAAKGLEFDTVVLVEPAAIVAESPRGVNDLYVALTRPTQRLHVVHSAVLPAGLSPRPSRPARSD